MGVVHALLRHREYALLGEEELLDRPFGGGMAAVGGITLEGCAVEGSNAPLLRCKLAAQDRCCLGTHEAVAGPQQFLGRIKGKGRYRRGRVVRSWRRQLHECKLQAHQLLFAHDVSQLIPGASGIGGAYLVPVRLHSDSTFTGIMCL